MWITVYAPQSLLAKVILWASLDKMIANQHLILVTMGDFNEVWEASERFGSHFNENQAAIFNMFISNAALNNVPLGIILEKGTPDHRHILLKEYKCHRHLAIKGILNEGDWIENPDSIKTTFVEHFRDRFQHTSGPLTSFDVDMLNNISSDQREFLECSFSRDEIKNAIWDYGGKSILDGLLILNEVIERYSKRKKKLMIFKVDFEKSFDSLRSSVLVNGSPMVEFEIFRGLRQGDPLSLFHLILAMEGLHTLTCKALDSGIFTGAYIDNDNLCISHLIYADDVIFLGEWSSTNAQNLLCILRCFFLVFVLKINVHKSNILGICVSDEETSGMANVIGCRASKLPLKYLGVPMDCNMSRCANWDAIINKFSYKLSRWKACMIFVGGCLTLIKLVLSSLPTYFMSLYKVPTSIFSKLESMWNNFFIGGNTGVKKMTWVSWNKCLASKKLGGLGIGSIFGLNAGLLFKWIWRFMQNSNDLWASVIKAIHGYNVGIHADSRHSSNQGTCCGILSMVNSLKSKGIDLLSLCTRKLGNGSAIRFWDDAWCGNHPLKVLFPRVYLLDIDKGFTVASVRHMIDARFLDVSPTAARWIRDIPIKVNVFLWRLSLNKLPSMMNLEKKGIDVDSILCPICNDDVETVNHLFFSCDMAKDLWSLLMRYWELDIPFFNISDWYNWLDSLSISLKMRLFLEDVGGTLMWCIWNFRNRLIFSNPPPKRR
nr:RNA-directed DNA polymerase, eukaryota [Tanacetum cinerariifolium]